MDFLKKQLERLKKHYEKIILSVVLLGLGAAVGFLPFKIAKERQEAEDIRNGILNKPVKPVPAINMEDNEGALAATKQQYELSLQAPPHNFCNPVPWIKSADGRLVKIATGREIGPERLEVTKLSPLYLAISLETVGVSGSNYLIRMENSAEPNARKRTSTKWMAPGDKTDIFTLKSVKGPLNAPQHLVIELLDTREAGLITVSNAFRRVESYTADLRYEPDKQSFRDKRVGAALSFAGEDFTIASINLIATNQYEVVLSTKQTGKKTTIKFTNAVAQP